MNVWLSNDESASAMLNHSYSADSFCAGPEYDPAHGAAFDKLYASGMIGCRYFRDALEIYTECLDAHARCVLYKDVYPLLAERYATSEACIDTAVRRWIKKLWADPEVRRMLFTVSRGKIADRPSNKQLLHVLAFYLIRKKREHYCQAPAEAAENGWKSNAFTPAFCGIISDTMRERGGYLGYKRTDQQD